MYSQKECVSEMAKRFTTQDIVARDMPEAELQGDVIDLAEALGYTVVHVRDARHQKLEGYPDLVIGGHRRIIHAELKRQEPEFKLTPMQEWWRDLILDAGHEWYLWRPVNWLDGTIQAILEKPPGGEQT